MKINRIPLLLILALAAFSCTTAPAEQEEDSHGNVAFVEQPVNIYEILGTNSFHYLHVIMNQDISEGEVIEAGQAMGKIEPWPEVLSPNNDEELKKAIRLYEEKKYDESFPIFSSIYKEEMNNPFFLYTFAKLLFWNQAYSDDAVQMFLKLYSMVEDSAKIPEGSLLLDTWFPDMYWKLGCLYLDRAMWYEGAVEITKFLILHGHENNEAIEQAFSYLTEAYYYMGDRVTFEYLYDKTLERFPGNTFVLQFK